MNIEIDDFSVERWDGIHDNWEDDDSDLRHNSPCASELLEEEYERNLMLEELALS